MAVEEIQSKEQFTSFIEGNQYVVIDFYANWCGPCKAVAPKIEALSQEISNVKFIKVDVDKFQELAQEYEVSAMPTFVIIKNKTKFDKVVGADYNMVKNAVNGAISS